MLAPGVTEKAAEFYKHFGADVKYVRDPEVAHTVPTDLAYFGSKGIKQKAKLRARQIVPKGETRFPYIANCGRDLAGEALSFLYADLVGRKQYKRRNDYRDDGELLRFDQNEFSGKNSGLSQFGYAFIPNACKNDAMKLSD